MSRKTIAILSITLIFGIIGAIGIVHWVGFEKTKVLTSTVYTYEGKMLMVSNEYTNFKQIIAREDVDIKHLEVYSSDNPLVIFRVDVPSELAPFYGQQVKTTYNYEYTAPWNEQNLYCGMACGGILLFLITSIFSVPKTE